MITYIRSDFLYIGGFMSASNRDKVRAQMQKNNTKGKSPWFWVLIVVLSIGVLGGIVYGAIQIQQSSKPDLTTVTQPSVVKDKGIIVGADRKIVEEPNDKANVIIYQDYICPGCKMFEESYAGEIDKLIDENVATIEYRSIGMLDSASAGTNYSSRAANVAMCSAVESPDNFYSLNKIFYSNQPAEGGPGLKNAELVKLAGSVGVNTENIQNCVDKGTYRGFIKQLTEEAISGNDDVPNGISGTPTVLVNGVTFELGGAKGLYDTVLEASKK